MNRRAFLLSGAAALALGGCSFKRKFPRGDQQLAFCQATAAASRASSVDMHCHLLTAFDVNAQAFFVRRILQSDESGVSDQEAGRIAGNVVGMFRKHVPSFENETRRLADLMANWAREDGRPTHPEPQICVTVIDSYKVNGTLEKFGFNEFVSSRIMNAAKMLHDNPSVALFTPSLIDLYEGSVPPVEDEAETRFYAALNLATRGRIVPLATFTPERQYEYDWNDRTLKKRGRKGDGNSPLARVERAIRSYGFIGVKLHPSSGFAPIDNRLHGCLNTPGQRDDRKASNEFDARVDHRFGQYDEYMKQLFLMCMRLDVPILVHGSTGIMSNSFCMTHKRPDRNEGDAFRYRPEKDAWPKHETAIDWSNSPKIWIETIKRMNELASKQLRAAREARASGRPLTVEEARDLELSATRHGPARKLRLCLGHFAGSFIENGREFAIHSWLDHVQKHIGAVPGLYVDLSSLAHLFGQNQIKPPGKEILSHVLGKPQFEGRVMYGSDWHMPSIAMENRSASYLSAIRDAVPGRMRSAVMGKTALRFFRLSDGQNRDRLEAFYRTPQQWLFPDLAPEEQAATVIDPATVPWWRL